MSLYLPAFSLYLPTHAANLSPAQAISQPAPATTEQPTTEQPTTEQPTTEQPTTEQPDTPAFDPASTACQADDPTGPFDDSVPTAIPKLTGRVIDLTGHLSPDCLANISARIRALEDEKGSQIRVLLVGSIGDESIEAYANRVFETWHLGRKDIDDGILLVAALQDHHDRIEVGRGLEGAIPDAVAGDILRNDLQPQFKTGNFGAGVSAAVVDLAHLIRGEPLPAPTLNSPSSQVEWMHWQFFPAALLLVALAGAAGSLADLRWYWRLSLPFLTLAFIGAVGITFHLLSHWIGCVIILPFALVSYLVGIFFANYPKSGLLWIACVTGVFLAALLAIRFFPHFLAPAQKAFWDLEAFGLSLIVGSWVLMVTSKNPMIGRHAFSSTSSSGSGSDSSDNDSSSSSSDDSSGGGGGSDGGGASGSW